MASGNNVASGAIVRGVRAEDLARRAVFADNIVEGSLARLDEGGTILIGSRMGQRMGLGVGDRVSLISPQGAATAFGTVPRIQSFEIAGIFEVGMFEYDNSFVYIGIDDAMRYFQLDDRVTAVEILVDDPEGAQLARPSPRRSPDHWSTGSSSARISSMRSRSSAMFLILTLIILVAAFNIITGITMLVKSKGRDIAILRHGATQDAVMRIFAGASIGVAGTLIGFGLGIAFALNIDSIRLFLEGLTGAELWSAEIRFLSRLPAEIDPDDVTRVVLMGLGLSFLATLYPAWRAARVDPVEALRYE